MASVGASLVGEQLDDRLCCLIQSSRSGNVAAFEAFYSETIRLLMPTARRLCGDDHAEDVLADTYVQAWLALATFDRSRGTALSWLKMMLRSRCLDLLRSERLRHAGAEGATEFDGDSLPSPFEGPEEILEKSRLLGRLYSALRQLPAKQRELVQLSFWQGCTHAEIAALTGWSAATVRSLVRDCRATLQDALR